MITCCLPLKVLSPYPALPDKLVLNTVIKMQKNEFCLNFYTDVRNTKIIKAPDYKNYKSVSLPFTAPNDGYICGGIYSLGTTACYIYVNSTQVGWNHSGGGSNTASPFMYPLSKGDMISFEHILYIQNSHFL